MDPSLWPLSGLAVRTGDIELRLPDEADLAALAALAASVDHPVHDPASMPFLTAWTDAPPLERSRSTLQWHWRQRGAWTPAAWSLELVAVRDGEVVGTQGCTGADFAVTREVLTGSWVGGLHQGQGVATAMRRAVTHLAFAGLGALTARSEAFEDNAASLRVSERLGYRRDGTLVHARRGQRAVAVRVVLERAEWEARRADWPPVEVTGLEECLEMFGAPG